MNAFHYIICGAILFTAEPVFAEVLPTLPTEPSDISLYQQFPAFPTDPQNSVLISHYLEQLEDYRAGVLEPYNTAVQAFSDDLRVFSFELERLKLTHGITLSDYANLNNEHDIELRNCGPNGKFIRTYVNYLLKYQGEAAWAIRIQRPLQK